MDENRKTPEYMRRAIKKYENNRERVSIFFEIGTKERAQKYMRDDTFGAWCKKIILKELERLEAAPGEDDGAG